MKRLGFDYAWLAEHHFTTEYGIMPDVFVYAGYLAALTKRITTGAASIMVHYPPWYGAWSCSRRKWRRSCAGRRSGSARRDPPFRKRWRETGSDRQLRSPCSHAAQRLAATDRAVSTSGLRYRSSGTCASVEFSNCPGASP
jgi:hypothetical protein